MAFGDDPSPIATDRPGFSDGSNLVPVGRLQFEGGFFRTQIGSDVTSSFGDGLFRFGVSDRFELRVLGISYGTSPVGEQWLDPSMGFKIRLLQNSKAEVTFIGQTTFPIGEGALRSNAWNTTFKIAGTAPLGAYTLGSNLVQARLGSGSAAFDQSALTLFLGQALSTKTTFTTELWGVNQTEPGGNGSAYASVALTHLLDANRQIDLRIGTGFNQQKDGWFLQGGYSVRF